LDRLFTILYKKQKNFLIALKLCYLIGSFIFAPQDIFNETSPETSQTSKRYADGGVYFTENLIINRGDLGDPIY